MKLSYMLEAGGWATAVIEHDRSRCEMRASYMSDSLAAMVRAAIRLCEGAPSATFSFEVEDEGVEHRCIVTRTRPGDVQIRVLRFERQFQAHLPEERGKQVFMRGCKAVTFCEHVFACSKAVLDEHGEAGYKEKWMMHEFPTADLEHLSRLLCTSHTDASR